MRRHTVVFLVVLIVGFLLRLYNFTSPIADWHSWRQTDTSAVSRNFVENGFDILHPRYLDISNIQTGKDNPIGYRFVEFPIFNIFQAGLYLGIPIFTIEEWGRLVSILASLASAFFIYKLASRYIDEYAGIASAAFYLFLPFSVYYGRTILPDTSMATASLGGIYFFDRYFDNINIHKKKGLNKNYLFFSLSILFTAVALLLKPYALFFTLSLFYFAYEKYKSRFILKWELWVYFVLSLIPLIAWRLWMLHYPEGIPASKWLFNEGNIRFKPVYFYWLFSERIGRLILGYGGIVILIAGLVKRSEKYLFLLSFVASSLLYMIVIARGNVQHDYYQILILPSISLLLGNGLSFLLTFKGQITKVTRVITTIALFPFTIGYLQPLLKSLVQENTGVKFYIITVALYGICFLFSVVISFLIHGVFERVRYINKAVRISLVSVLIIFMLYISSNAIIPYYNLATSLVNAGERANAILPKDAKVIAPRDGDTTLLYYIHRKGWPAFQQSTEELMQKGATHLVLLNPTSQDKQEYKRKYTMLDESNDYIIVKLN